MNGGPRDTVEVTKKNSLLSSWGQKRLLVVLTWVAGTCLQIFGARLPQQVLIGLLGRSPRVLQSF